MTEVYSGKSGTFDLIRSNSFVSASLQEGEKRISTLITMVCKPLKSAALSSSVNAVTSLSCPRIPEYMLHALSNFFSFPYALTNEVEFKPRIDSLAPSPPLWNSPLPLCCVSPCHRFLQFPRFLHAVSFRRHSIRHLCIARLITSFIV